MIVFPVKHEAVVSYYWSIAQNSCTSYEKLTLGKSISVVCTRVMKFSLKNDL